MIAGNLYRAWMTPKMGYYSRHPEKYSEQFRYEYDRYAINLMKKTGRITTEGFGMENLPKEGGYVMFSNHQGKYDARSHGPLVKQFIDLVEGKRLKIDNLKQAAGIIKEVTREVKEGRKFIIFPSGGYEHRNGNYVDEFKPGAFKSAMKAKAPIVPVAIVDSWKVFDLWSLRKVKTEVFYLKPMLYDEYKDKKSVEISSIIHKRICAAVELAQNGDFLGAVLQ